MVKMKRTLINYLGILGIISLISYTLAVVKTNNKEQRIMKDTDHKLSREIVNTAKAHDISVIKLERLQIFFDELVMHKKDFLLLKSFFLFPHT